jgi:hypothetical protein
MANESGGGGGGKYRGRKKRKTGVRKTDFRSAGDSYTLQPPMSGNFGIAPGNREPGLLQGLLSQASSMFSPGFTTPSESGALQKLLGQASDKFGGGEPAGGFDMQKVAPQVTMQARPPKETLDDNAAGYDAGATAMDFLSSLMTQPGAGFDYETAQREAAGAIRQAYGAEINAIRQNNRVARKSSRHARKEIEHLYKGLARMYGKQEAKALRRGEKTADAQMDIAKEGNTILQDLNNTMIQDETAMLQNLGQQQAAGELISPDYDRMGQQVAENTEMGTRAASQATRMGANNARWFDRAQGGARLEGANNQADMIAQLQAYLMDNRNQIAGLKGQRAQEVAASNMSIQSQAAEAASANQGEIFDQGLDIVKFLLDQDETERVQDREDAEFRWDKKMDRKNLRLKMLDAQESGDTKSLANLSPGIEDAMSIIASQRDPNDKKATNALWKLFASNAWRTGEVALPGNAGQTANLTPYEAAARARKVGMSMGLKGKELSDFVNAAAASVR